MTYLDSFRNSYFMDYYKYFYITINELLFLIVEQLFSLVTQYYEERMISSSFIIFYFYFQL